MLICLLLKEGNSDGREGLEEEEWVEEKKGSKWNEGE